MFRYFIDGGVKYNLLFRSFLFIDPPVCQSNIRVNSDQALKG